MKQFCVFFCLPIFCLLDGSDYESLGKEKFILGPLYGGKEDPFVQAYLKNAQLHGMDPSEAMAAGYEQDKEFSKKEASRVSILCVNVIFFCVVTY